MQRQGEKSGGSSSRTTWYGLYGALLIIVVALVLLRTMPKKPEVLLPVTAHISFSGSTLTGNTPDPVAVRLHNFITLCAAGDLSGASDYIDPESDLVGRPEAACGPVTGMLNTQGATVYQFDRVAAEDDRATVYVTTRQQKSEGERYTFFMRKVKGKWYFSVP